MKFRYILILIIAFAIVFSTSCIINDNSIKRYNYTVPAIDNDNTLAAYYFYSAGQYKDEIYYINTTDNKIYQYNESIKTEEPFINIEVEWFVFTEDYLICIDKENKIYIINLENYEIRQTIIDARKTKRSREGFGYPNYPDCIIYDEYMIYITSNNEIGKLEFENLHSEILLEGEEVFLMSPYKDAIIYTIITDNLSYPNSLCILQLDTHSTYKLKDGYYYNIRISDDWIYYVDDYSIYRKLMETGEYNLVLRNSSIFDFEVSDSKIICQAYEGLTICNKDGSDVKIITAEKCGILQANGDYAFYYERESQNKYIINLVTLESMMIKADGHPMNCRFFSDMFYVRCGEYNTEENVYEEMNSVFQKID